MARQYIDFDLVAKYPNKYGFSPQNINTIKVLDWDRLKKETWENVSKEGKPRCKLIGSQDVDSKKCDDEDEFWIGFYPNGRVDHHFTSHEGMCGYVFHNFYDSSEIENKWDMNVQVNTIRFLNHLVDDGIISPPVVNKKG